VTPDILVLGLTWFVVFLFSTTLHEAGHAFAAYKLGDPTAYEGGQVSLNPLPHIQREPLGMVLVPLITFAANHWMMGWASAPYDPLWAHRYPKRAAIMALAGPAGNLILVLISGTILRLGLTSGVYVPVQPQFERLVGAAVPGGLAEASVVPLSIFFFLNLLLFFFNLLPLPPLDGGRVLVGLLPEPFSSMLGRIEPFGFLILLLLLMTRTLNRIIGPPMDFLLKFFLELI
jgi:Zn-dependent protease